MAHFLNIQLKSSKGDIMKKRKKGLILLGVIGLLSLVGCSSFPRSTVSTEEQDITAAVYDSSVDFSPSAIGTIQLNYHIFLLDTAETNSDIVKPEVMFQLIKDSLEAQGYTVDSVNIPRDSIDTTFAVSMVTVSEGVSEFTMHYYYDYWGWYGGYYPPYYGGWYSYTYTVGSIVLSLNTAHAKHTWAGVVSGFTDNKINQTSRISRGISELFTLAPFNK